MGLGNFNFSNINWFTWTTPHNEESKEAQFIETIGDCYLYQQLLELIRSRSTDNPSLIDLVLTNEVMQLLDIEYHAPLCKNDHVLLPLSIIAIWITPNRKEDMSIIKLILIP